MSRMLPVTVLISWDMWGSENVVSGCQTYCYEPSCLVYYDVTTETPHLAMRKTENAPNGG